MKAMLHCWKILIPIILAFSLASCFQEPILATPMNSTNSIILIASPTSVVPITPQITLTSLGEPEALSTPQPTVTFGEVGTPTVDLQLREKCVKASQLPMNMPQGSLVLEGSGTIYGELGAVFLLDLETSQKQRVGQQRDWGGHVGVSPDHRRLAFIYMQYSKLRIVNASGEVLESITVPEDWQSIIQWIQDDKILIEKMRYIGNSRVYGYSSTMTFEISTREHQEYLPEDYPNKSTLAGGINWEAYHHSIAVYDPIFTRVVYPANYVDDYPLVLWNLETQSEIKRIHCRYADFGGVPIWTRDGSYFFAGIYPLVEWWNGEIYENVMDDLPYMGGHEIFRVSREGELERLTYLTTEYKAGEEGRSLSSDERYVAFWLNLDFKPRDRKASRTLAILDMENGEITDLCFAGGDYPYPPIWSPDGKHLLVTVLDQNNGIFEVFLVDLEQRLVTQVAEDAVGVGWLVEDSP